MQHHRRDTLKQGAAVAGLLACAGLWPQTGWAFNKSAFDAKSVAEASRAYGGSAPVASRDVTVDGPEISENGASVPLSLSTTLPGVRQLLLLVEKNPSVLVAKFDVGDAVEASFSVRAKMAQTSDVYAVALMHDGRALFAKREVKVTLGGCG